MIREFLEATEGDVFKVVEEEYNRSRAEFLADILQMLDREAPALHQFIVWGDEVCGGQFHCGAFMTIAALRYFFERKSGGSQYFYALLHSLSEDFCWRLGEQLCNDPSGFYRPSFALLISEEDNIEMKAVVSFIHAWSERLLEHERGVYSVIELFRRLEEEIAESERHPLV